MQSSSTTHPLILLSELEEACKKQIPNIPSSSSNSYWVGIGFLLNQYCLAIKTNYIGEVLDATPLNNISKVPAAKSWFMGLISLRGQPLPIIDLKDYLLGEPTLLGRNNRLIVIMHNNVSTGLLVEEVFSLKQFEESDMQEQLDIAETFSTTLQRFIPRMFEYEKKNWGELSIETLASDTEFTNASIF